MKTLSHKGAALIGSINAELKLLDAEVALTKDKGLISALAYARGGYLAFISIAAQRVEAEEAEEARKDRSPWN